MIAIKAIYILNICKLKYYGSTICVLKRVLEIIFIGVNIGP